MRSWWIVNWYRRFKDWFQGRELHERSLELVGATLARATREKESPESLRDVEFRVYSQFGDDGIIQWLVARLPSLPRRFIEFGIGDYSESNTRFLMVNDNWSGLVLDCSQAGISRLRDQPWFWRFDLTARCCLITRENVDAILAEWAGGEPVGILHIDVDGNDYWLWQAVNSIQPGLVIMEYNAIFGTERALTIPYTPDFDRHRAHYSGQYYGASIAALTSLANNKGYALIGGNSAGNNAYFLRRDLLDTALREVSVEQAYSVPRFRESRDPDGRLNYASFKSRQSMVRGLPLVDVEAGDVVVF